MKNLINFLKNDFVTQVFSLNVLIAVFYVSFLFNEISALTQAFIFLAFIVAGSSVYKLFKSRVTVRYELMLLLPLFIFATCLTFGLIHKYNEVGSLSQLMTYSSLSRLIDFAVGAGLVYGSFLGIMGFSCSYSAKEHFKVSTSNIQTLTGHKPDFVHYGITRYNKTFLTLNSFVFNGAGLIRDNSVVGYHVLYNYMKDQNIAFSALSDDDFLLMDMVKI